jgi:hypothetical protein
VKQRGGGEWPNLSLHQESQDTTSTGWIRLINLIDEAAADGREEFAPGREMDPNDWTQVVTLPASISKLTRVKHLNIYGSSLVRIPPQIGNLRALAKFSPYMSHRLHRFPYEITRCKKLVDSTVSTRALYGNYKYRPPFPPLPKDALDATPSVCSVCSGPFRETGPQQVWISLRVATDVLPLLVHACSKVCIAKLPTPPEGYVQTPHLGGKNVRQPRVG